MGLNFAPVNNAVADCLKDFSSETQRLHLLKIDYSDNNVSFSKINVSRNCEVLEIGSCLKTVIEEKHVEHIRLTPQLQKILSLPKMLTEIKH